MKKQQKQAANIKLHIHFILSNICSGRVEVVCTAMCVYVCWCVLWHIEKLLCCMQRALSDSKCGSSERVAAASASGAASYTHAHTHTFAYICLFACEHFVDCLHAACAGVARSDAACVCVCVWKQKLIYVCVRVCVWSDVDRMLMPIIFLPSQQNTVNTRSHVTFFSFLPAPKHTHTHTYACANKWTACLLACCLSAVPLGHAQLEILPYFTLDHFFLVVNCVVHIVVVVVLFYSCGGMNQSEYVIHM